MNAWSIDLAPLFPLPIIIGLAVVAGFLVAYGILRGLRGAWMRAGAWVLLALALLNPSLLREDREQLKTVVAVVVDETDSQKFDDRDTQTEATRAAVKALIDRMPQFELREVVAKNGGAETGDASSALFSTLQAALGDVPPEQVGGAILLTDGQVHDVPESREELSFNAPVHALLSGSEDDRDRRLQIVKAPRFGIVGQSQELTFRVDDTNIDPALSQLEIRLSIDGELVTTERIVSGQDFSLFFDVPHGGKNVIELEAESVDDEITTVNNRAFTVLDGIRENLRVLLVSGEPHAGERTWRNLLKSDASVDLVHFTILRPPEKQDGTPINQLSLIAFPTRELFIEKIDEFDLIIFDRYQRRGVLPVLYFDNIARYLEEGGAILVAAGPEHSGPASLDTTPLSRVMPVRPTGNVTTGPFKPLVSDEGRRHPVTNSLPGLPALGAEGDAADPDWSRWFRQIDGTANRGSTVMNGPNDQPLLVLDRPGDGRIAMLMSDHVWLWARGFEGGGPHSQLLRRLGHWLMKEPELDEEALRAEANGNRITVERQTMGDEPGPLTLITPSGDVIELAFEPQGDGKFAASYEAPTLGLYRLANGDLTALTHVGPVNPREYSDIVSTASLLEPVANSTGGNVLRMARDGSASALPNIIPVRGNSATSGNGWIGLRTTDATRLIGVSQIPLLAGFLGLAILLLAMAGMWAREGR
ncbi:membrane protein [Ahrensia sp. R2A130]|uniref:membrane protein n=1 Tax=Ahrensia sp. R2A130 TaxID=744979 RepID=UPI0001E0F8AA|nr:membrane protein [Ahrensia sp. R2A130]EFL89047.1 conserved hypothetical protein [Ahrensia sp. R2A130]